MDESALRRLADTGIHQDIGSGEVEDIADWCWERCEATGDARWCIIWKALWNIVREWEYTGGLPQSMMRGFSAALASHIPGVIDAPDSETGALLAKALREEVVGVFRNPPAQD
jgi:hypothetical protein